MSYQIYTHGLNGFKPFWNNYIEHLNEKLGYSQWQVYKYDAVINADMHKYHNGRLSPGHVYVEFINEESALLFMLKYS